MAPIIGGVSELPLVQAKQCFAEVEAVGIPDRYGKYTADQGCTLRKRYSVTLNAPTTTVKALGDQLTSHVDQDTVYHLSILDTAPVRDEAHQYHSVVRVCLDDEPQESSSRQLTASENSANINICTIEYAPFPPKNGSSPQILPTLHSSLEKSFSVTWSSSTVTGGSYCLIPISFRNFSGPGNVALKLLVGTERIQMIDATLSRAEQYEESFARIRLFSGGDAQETRAAEIADVERQIIALQHAIEQTKMTPTKATSAQSIKNDASACQGKSEKSATKKRKASTDLQPTSACMKDQASLTSKLLTTRQRLSAVRPVQVFRPVVSVQGQQPQFHMPSQQTKVSNAGAQGSRTCSESKNTKTLRTSMYKSVNPSSKIPTATAETSRRRRPSPMVCFYVRPEHLPNADYIAIYLSDQDFPSLLSAISSKLQIPMDTIGTIYYYDQQMTPVVVNDISIKSLSHEQDFIVRLPWLAKHLSELPAEAQYQSAFPPEGFSDHASMFDQYLTIPLEGSYATSVGSWSDFTDDASMSMSHMFAQSTTLSPAGELHFEGSHIHHSVLGEQGIDYARYEFDAVLPTMSLSSTPMQSTLQLAAPIPDIMQTLPPQAEIVEISAIEERLVSGTACPVNEELAETRFPPSHSPPASRTHTAGRPTSLRNYQRPPSVENRNFDGKTPNPGQTDQDTAYALERNRLAAMKCRVTRKEKETRLQELSKEKLEMNEELKYEIRRLEAEISEAKGLLKMHVVCA